MTGRPSMPAAPGLSAMKKLLASFFGALALAATAATPDQPNVIFILADDLGWSDTTLYGHTTFYRTPNLERLASRGMLFTRAYAASPLCSPTRASIVTGQSPARIGITTPGCHVPEVKLQAGVQTKAPADKKALMCVSATRLNTNYFTLAEAMKARGYATAHFGKWHLGAEPYSPLQQGFDVDLPHWSGPGPAGSYVAPWKFPPKLKFKERTPQEHIEDRMGDEAVAWMEQNKDHPFFLNYWQFSVHAPFNAKSNLIEKYRGRADPKDAQHSPTYAAMVESMDDAVGKLLDAVDRFGISDRTVIVFCSDNGGNMYNVVDGTTPTSNRPLRGGKATVYEGGVRVPCIVRWPGLTPPGSRNDTIIQSSDFYPTFVQLLGLKTPPGQIFDGVSIANTFAGKPLAREAIFTYFPHSTKVPDTLPPAVTVTTDEWKLIRTFFQGEGGRHAYQLYNLKDDLGETRDLAAVQPDRVKALDALIERFLAETKAVTPKPNPAYDPKAKPAPELPKRKPGKPAPAPGGERQQLEAESEAGL
jgi:arylsulfatase A-like enzyme